MENSTPIATEAQDMNHNDRSTARSASGKTGIEIAHTPPLSEAGIPRPQQVHSPQQPKSLQQEFLLVNFDVNNVKVTEVNHILVRISTLFEEFIYIECVSYVCMFAVLCACRRTSSSASAWSPPSAAMATT